MTPLRQLALAAGTLTMLHACGPRADRANANVSGRAHPAQQRQAPSKDDARGRDERAQLLWSVHNEHSFLPVHARAGRCPALVDIEESVSSAPARPDYMRRRGVVNASAFSGPFAVQVTADFKLQWSASLRPKFVGCEGRAEASTELRARGLPMTILFTRGAVFIELDLSEGGRRVQVEVADVDASGRPVWDWKQ